MPDVSPDSATDSAEQAVAVTAQEWPSFGSDVRRSTHGLVGIGEQPRRAGERSSMIRSSHVTGEPE